MTEEPQEVEVEEDEEEQMRMENLKKQGQEAIEVEHGQGGSKKEQEDRNEEPLEVEEDKEEQMRMENMKKASVENGCGEKSKQVAFVEVVDWELSQDDFKQVPCC